MWCFPSTPCLPGVVSRKSLQHFRTLHCLSHYTLEELKQSAFSVHETYLPVQYTHTQHFWLNFQEKCQAWNLVILAILLFPTTYRLSWYVGQFGCMNLTSWQIWNFSVCPIIVCVQYCCSQCTWWQICWALNGEETQQMPVYIYIYMCVCVCVLLLFIILSDDRSKASSKLIPPHIAIQSFLFQMRVSSSVFMVIQ